MIRQQPTTTLLPNTTHFRSPADDNIEEANRNEHERSSLVTCKLGHEDDGCSCGPQKTKDDDAAPKHHIAPQCRTEEHTFELQSQPDLVCCLLLENKNYAL